MYGTTLTAEQLLAANKAPTVWRFTDLTEAYAEVQCNPDVEDGDVVVANTERHGLTVGFVYHRAWLATVHQDHPEGGWDKLGDPDETARQEPQYALPLSQARLTRAEEESAKAAKEAEARWLAKPSQESYAEYDQAREWADDDRVRSQEERTAYRRTRDDAKVAKMAASKLPGQRVLAAQVASAEDVASLTNQQLLAPIGLEISGELASLMRKAAAEQGWSLTDTARHVVAYLTDLADHGHLLGDIEDDAKPQQPELMGTEVLVADLRDQSDF